MSRIRGAIAFAFVAVSGLALGGPSADFNKFMQAEGPKVMKAFKTKDIKYFEKMSTSDFTYKAFGQPAQKKQPALEGMKQMFGMMKSIDDASFKLHSSKVSGNTATVTMTFTLKGTTMPDPKTKKSSKMVAISHEKETWVKQGNTWKLKKIEETKAGKMTMDGVAIPMGGGGH